MARRIAVFGAAGRMGAALMPLLQNDPRFELAAALDGREHPLQGSDIGPFLGRAPLGICFSTLDDFDPLTVDAVLDFSSPEALLSLLAALERAPKPLVSGTTGIGPEHKARLAAYAQKTPVVWAANFSRGVNLLLDLVARAARALGEKAEGEIVEIHHHHKKDAPSGTALRLAEALSAGLGLGDKARLVNGREGVLGARQAGEIGLHAVRGGEVTGEHTVYLFAPGERLELTHRLGGREALAGGAVAALAFVLDRPAGLYDMPAVLGL